VKRARPDRLLITRQIGEDFPECYTFWFFLVSGGLILI
jgi:hypothetical protein